MDQKIEALKVLEEDLQQRKQMCWNEIGAALQKYNFQIDVVTVLRQGRIIHNLDLMSVPAPQQNQE